MSFPSILPCFTQNPLLVTNIELIGFPKISASILNIFFCVAEIKGLKTITNNKPRIIETEKMGKTIFLIVKPVVLITTSSFVLLTFSTQSIPEKKKQNGKISNSIFGKFKELNINIKEVPTFSLEDSFFPNSTVSPINIIEANSTIIVAVEKRNVLDMYLYISEFKFTFKPFKKTYYYVFIFNN